MSIKVIGALLVVMALMAFYGMWQKLEIANLVGEVKSLTIELSVSKENEKVANTSLKFQQEQFADSTRKITELGVKLVEAQENVTYVKKLFNGQRFRELLEKNPTLIELRMIKATEKVLQELEDVTKP